MKKPKFKPMPGKVVVRLSEEERIGSLIVPINSQRQRTLGTIIAIGGDEVVSDDGDYYDLKVGDQVIFGQHSGVLVSIGREQVLVLRTGEILTTLEWEDDVPPAGLRVEAE